MSRVLITGVAGFLGRYISRRFEHEGWEVFGVDSVVEENAPCDVLIRYLNAVLPSEEFTKFVANWQPNLIVHCAGRASAPLSVEHPEVDFDGNTLLTFRLLEMIRCVVPDCSFIHLSSAAVYGNPIALPITELTAANPISPYGFHKLQAESICQEYAIVYGVKTCSLRVFSAYGPGLRRQVVWDLTSKVMRGAELKLRGTGDETRDFVHARDVANAAYLVSQKAEFNGQVFNVASGVETSILSLARGILEAAGKEEEIQFDGVAPIGIPIKWRADISKLEQLGFRNSMAFEEGITQFVRWAVPLIV